jgi:undecaprenyl diphosphate synthase
MKKLHTQKKDASLPSHVGIIMDGNGRWARLRNKPRTFGHEEGLNAAKRIVREAATIGIGYVTLYTFSTENWKRTKKEVSFLMSLIGKHLRKELDFYKELGIRVISSGDRKALPKAVIQELEGAENDTADFSGLTLNLAINYGGKDEIVRACNRLLGKQALDAKGKTRILRESDISANLDHPEMPDMDLVIRTGGEQRLSNFFIWESAYAELYFSSKLWPDWDKGDLRKAIAEFKKRERRFGNAK